MVKPPDTSDVPRKARAAYDSLPLRPTLSRIIGAKNAKKSCTTQAVQSLTAITKEEAFNILGDKNFSFSLPDCSSSTIDDGRQSLHIKL